METKICTKCGIEKENINFRIMKNKRLCSLCRECEKESKKKYRLNNKDKAKIYYMNNLDRAKKYRKEYYIKNKETIRKKHKKYLDEHKEEKRIQDKKYRDKNRKILNAKILERKEKDPVYKLKCNVRGMIKNSFRRRGLKKKQKGEEIYCCNIDFLIKHLILTYEKNYNEKWDWEFLKIVHVDHIIPLSTANTEEEVIKLCHYKNLQLLKAEDNLKKSDKIELEVLQ